MLADVVRNLVVLIIVATILELLLPRNHFRPFINMVVGLVLMLMLLAPVRMLLQLPGDTEPAVLRAAGVSEADYEGRLEMLTLFNWELSLSRYRGMLAEKIAEVLAREGYTMAGLRLEVIGDPTHLEFGRPLKVEVVAGARDKKGAGEIRPVEPVRVGERGATPPEGEVVEDRRLSAKVAAALGLPGEIVRVVVAD
jgi:stage III sporulation protein AF